MILTDNMIEESIKEGVIKIEPFETKQIQPASYDLRVGEEAARSSTHGKVNVKEVGYIELEAGDFAILTTEEIVTLDNQHVGRIGLRSKWSRKWIVATAGPQIDPGFNGNKDWAN